MISAADLALTLYNIHPDIKYQESWVSIAIPALQEGGNFETEIEFYGCLLPIGGDYGGIELPFSLGEFSLYMLLPKFILDDKEVPIATSEGTKIELN